METNPKITNPRYVSPLALSSSLGRDQPETTASIATPPEFDASPSQVTPSIWSGFPDSLLVLIYTPGWREAM